MVKHKINFISHNIIITFNRHHRQYPLGVYKPLTILYTLRRVVRHCVHSVRGSHWLTRSPGSRGRGSGGQRTRMRNRGVRICRHHRNHHCLRWRGRRCMIWRHELARGPGHMDGPRERLRGDTSIGGSLKNMIVFSKYIHKLLGEEKLACM